MGISIGSVILQSGVNTLSTAVISGYTIGTKSGKYHCFPYGHFWKHNWHLYWAKLRRQKFYQVEKRVFGLFSVGNSLPVLPVLLLYNYLVGKFVSCLSMPMGNNLFHMHSSISAPSHFSFHCFVWYISIQIRKKGIGNGLASMTGGIFELTARILVSYFW